MPLKTQKLQSIFLSVDWILNFISEALKDTYHGQLNLPWSGGAFFINLGAPLRGISLLENDCRTKQCAKMSIKTIVDSNMFDQHGV